MRHSGLVFIQATIFSNHFVCEHCFDKLKNTKEYLEILSLIPCPGYAKIHTLKFC